MIETIADKMDEPKLEDGALFYLSILKLQVSTIEKYMDSIIPSWKTMLR